MKGIFITFEGPDGSGKTTQLKLLAEDLREKGFDVVTTREPGGTRISDKVREILLNPENKELHDTTEILLYAAARAQHVHEIIIPNLEQGRIVLCDRYIDASIAYQSFGLGINREIIEEINEFASSKLQPSRTYLLYIDSEISQARLNQRTENEFANNLDRIEQKNLDYHKRVANGFLKLAEEEFERILKIDANQSIDAIFNLVRNDMELLLKNKNM